MPLIRALLTTDVKLMVRVPLDAAVAVNFTNYVTRHGVAQMWFHAATHRSADAFIPASKTGI